MKTQTERVSVEICFQFKLNNWPFIITVFRSAITQPNTTPLTPTNCHLFTHATQSTLHAALHTNVNVEIVIFPATKSVFFRAFPLFQREFSLANWVIADRCYVQYQHPIANPPDDNNENEVIDINKLAILFVLLEFSQIICLFHFHNKIFF